MKYRELVFFYVFYLITSGVIVWFGLRPNSTILLVILSCILVNLVVVLKSELKLSYVYLLSKYVFFLTCVGFFVYEFLKFSKIESIVQYSWFLRMQSIPVTFFLLLLLLNFLIKTAVKEKKLIIKKWKEISDDWVLVAVIVVVAGTFIYQFTVCVEKMDTLAVRSWGAREVKFLDRFVSYEYGLEHNGWMWEFSKFVTVRVPEQATIFIPPQNSTWAQEGNKFYFRWFVYPRNLLQSDDPHAPIPSSANFVLLSNGGWSNAASGWPKKSILSSCIKRVELIDRKSLQTKTVDPQSLDTTLLESDWGVIELLEKRSQQCN